MAALRLSALALLVLLGACSGRIVPEAGGAARPPAPRPAPQTSPPPVTQRGLELVMGQDRDALIRRFGPPRADTVEMVGRRLQFAGPRCVLDAYLYPDGPRDREIVTHVDARGPDGQPVDRAACVAALRRG